ncbi:MAG TPA: hypothetical protein VNV36_07180 [Pseudomonas sp.]|uniref:hypothetical protein n=1 Tax=Pseudomonas sp. TaxID=306 RepID=UPI002C2943ED|nr:hypothetical protein [Pseudomonas sp.]HWH86542.1 hypothetical protein [Pseudomonas sp.]
MLRFFIFALVSLLANLSSAQDADYLQGQVIQGPFKTDVIKGGELSFLQTRSEEFPVSLVLDVEVDGAKNRSLVDKYDVAGSDPKIESIFFYPVKGKKNVLVLVSWEITSRGIGTYGTLYQVYGYEKSTDNKLVVNKLVRFDRNLSGMEGYQEGEEQHFSYVNAGLIKAYFKKINGTK